MKSQFTSEEQALFHKLEDKKLIIQEKLNKFNQEIKQAALIEAEIRGKVAALKPELVPFAEMQAALANPVSRDKYFSHLSKIDFIKHVRDSLQ